ncbi:MAG: ABC transporter substrate-binding protein [Proteobacteria bacterium]|nr:ABC transporter substrate-binding protein [Pseudomonadota bacterium]
MRTTGVLWAAGLGMLLAVGVASVVSAAAATPKRGGTLTYTIPADAPASFDGHRETSFATVHSIAPFYSVLIRINPDNPSSTTDFVCDLCTEMPKPTDDGRTWAFKIRPDVKWHDGSLLTADDVATSWRYVVNPPEGISSARESFYLMVDRIEVPDRQTVTFRLKFASNAFLPALADPFAVIYKKAILEKDPRWYEKNIMGSGPFRFTSYEVGQSIKGVRNPDYYRKGQPYLDGFIALYAPKQAVRVDAIRADRAAVEFRGLPPSARDQLVKELGDKVTVQSSDWNCGSVVTVNHRRKPFDDVRVRRALTLAVDRWRGAPSLAKIANVRTVGGIVFPGSPMAATREELEKLPGYWPDIDKSRAEAKRLLREAGAEGLSFEMLNRNVDQPYKFVGTWLIDEWSKVGLRVTQRVVPTGPWFEAMRSGNFEVVLQANCHGVVNPLTDVGNYLPHTVYTENYGQFEDQQEIDLYDEMVRETDVARQRGLMRRYETYVLDTAAHTMHALWWHRIVPQRSYVKGWKISPSHYINQDLANVWLDK